MFGTLVLAVAESTAKRTFFTLEERVAMAKEVLGDVKNLEIVGFRGLLTEFVRQHAARVVLRGLRAVSDFEYEFQLAGMNRRLMPDVETVFLTPEEHHLFISATLVREIGQFGGDIGQFVNPIVKKRFEKKLKEGSS